MTRFLDRTVTVALSAALVVGGLEPASYAANGRALTLGQRNTETRPAALTNTGKGPALSLRSPAGRRSRIRAHGRPARFLTPKEVLAGFRGLAVGR